MDLLALHRVRSRLVSQRTGVTNQIRGFLLERGITVRQGLAPLRQALPGILGSSSDALSSRIVRLIVDLAEDWRRLDERIADVSAEIEAPAAQDEHCQRLMSVPGVGRSSRPPWWRRLGQVQASSWGGTLALGSTGDRTILGKISKRGNKYLRTLFVQAAHIVLVRRPHGARLGLWPWVEAAGRRLHRNMLVIALANKLARIAWAVLARGHAYQPRGASHAV
jgi:transposase